MGNLLSIGEVHQIAKLNKRVRDTPLPGEVSKFIDLDEAHTHARNYRNALGEVSCKLAKCIIRLLRYADKPLYTHHFFDALNVPDKLLVAVAEKGMDYPSDLGHKFKTKALRAKKLLSQPTYQPLHPADLLALESFTSFLSVPAKDRLQLTSKIICFLASDSALKGLDKQPVHTDLAVCIIDDPDCNDGKPTFRIGTTKESHDLMLELKYCGAVIVRCDSEMAKSNGQCCKQYYVFLNDEEDKPMVMKEELLEWYGFPSLGVRCA
ncbi:hypothetical protein IB292_02925 [Vibrio parahaemolyticus]|uniref:Uncharacterized protein n=1 Tax=Vibrio parahaemolyticus TaxID=670 RepID=A0A9Q3YGG0_VIBPH|nr:hypothetical protein [Vibrio parahaemolyticus]MCC3803984.1 hypothetical protein [Vibrio parahaemolyticus]